jgi:diamine N-acetyltransferase
MRKSLQALDKRCWRNDTVSIKPIETMDELIYAGYDCRLTEEQKDMVSPFWFTIGRAYLFPENHYPCIIYNEKSEAIGFINLCKWSGDEAYSWSFYIDKDHQGKGNGRSSASLAISILKTVAPDMPIKLATEQSNVKAQRLYTSLGFRKADELDGDDLVYVL